MRLVLKLSLKAALLTTLLLSDTSCNKDPQNLVEGTWKIESVTFNGEERKEDPGVMGIVKYDASYDPYWAQTYDGSHGAMTARSSANDRLYFVYISFPYESADTMNCAPFFDTLYTGGYLPGMISSGGGERWRILELTHHKFWIQYKSQDDLYIVKMKK